jgi:S-(hydroxymethyl)glutathione dehydrogenase/alcohol dehydrogenase
MDVRAAVAVAAGKPLEVTTVQLEGPREGEVLVEIKATGICHTDEFTLSGADPEGLFPAILGHEGAGIVVDIGKGVTSVKEGSRHPCTRRNAGSARACRARPILHRDPRRKARPMPDGTALTAASLFILHGHVAFANYTVLPEIAVAKIRRTRR